MIGVFVRLIAVLAIVFWLLVACIPRKLAK